MIPSLEESKRFVSLGIRVSRLCVTNYKGGIMYSVYINKLLHFLFLLQKNFEWKKKEKKKSSLSGN